MQSLPHETIAASVVSARNLAPRPVTSGVLTRAGTGQPLPTALAKERKKASWQYRVGMRLKLRPGGSNSLVCRGFQSCDTVGLILHGSSTKTVETRARAREGVSAFSLAVLKKGEGERERERERAGRDSARAVYHSTPRKPQKMGAHFGRGLHTPFTPEGRREREREGYGGPKGRGV